MLKKLSEKGLLLVVILVITFLSVLICWLTGSFFLSAVLVIAFLVIIYIARSAWITTDSNYRLRRFTISVISIAAIPSNTLLYDIIRKLLKDYASINLPSNDLAPEMMLFLLAILTIVFYFTREKNGFANTDKPIDKLIEGPTIKQKWENVCRGLESQIRDIDRDTNWSNEYYTPLEAEVEMRTSKGTKKVVKDLLEAIKKSKDRLFLMIGDPGAGKSVALRKLCLDILKESVKKEYIPIYVNLKEWVSQTDWTKQSPTWKELETFVKESLQNKDRHLGDFFEKYYDVLDENGNLFFVLDSFDEIPQVLGANIDSKLIEDLTKVCREFLVGAKQPRSRGILASREYRMPRSEYLEANTTLRVRPFSEAKIEFTLLRTGKVQKETVTRIFREKRDLIPILRNPFISSLLQSYLANTLNKLPNTQSELYSDYIDNSIQQAQKRLNMVHIPKEEILDFAIQAAKLIFSESGLQAPIGFLRNQIQNSNFDDIVSILRYTRIARGNIIGADIFSFTHRRFYEYFVVCDLLKQKSIDLPLENIPTDSRWRDTLVLYCEVAPFEQAQKIANYCWEVISKAANIGERHSKHCLRFLTEAFKGRLDCLIGFHEKLASFILEQIEPEKDPIDVKIAVEALGILGPEDVDKGAIKAFLIGDAWINDTALRSCRHLDSISKDLSYKIEQVLGIKTIISFSDIENGEKRNIDSDNSGLILFSSLSGFRFLYIKMDINDLDFSFKLSEAFKKFQKVIAWFKIEKWFKLPLMLICFFLGVIFNSLDLLNLQENSGMYFVVFLLIYVLVSQVVEFFYLNKKISIKIKSGFNWKQDVFMPICGIFLIVLIAYILVKVAQKIILFLEDFDWFEKLKLYAFWLILATIISFSLYVICKAIYNFFDEVRFFNTFNKELLNNRNNIALVYSRLDFYLPVFISYLENNVRKVSGKFPDKFLQAGKNSYMTRLIQLEAMWREVEEREEN